MAITPNTPNPVREDAYKTELATKLGIDPQYIPSSPVWRNEEEIAAIAEMFSNMTAGSSGGVLVVNETIDGNTHTLDKTYEEIMAAGFAVKKSSGNMGDTYNTLASSYGNAGVVFYVNFSDDPSAYYSASTSTGTLTYTSK